MTVPEPLVLQRQSSVIFARLIPMREQRGFVLLLNERASDIPDPGTAPLLDKAPPLSRREHQTLQCLLAGDSEKEAAIRLGIARNTLHRYVTSLYRRFDVCSRAELMARFMTR